MLCVQFPLLYLNELFLEPVPVPEPLRGRQDVDVAEHGEAGTELINVALVESHLRKKSDVWLKYTYRVCHNEWQCATVLH